MFSSVKIFVSYKVSAYRFICLSVFFCAWVNIAHAFPADSVSKSLNDTWHYFAESDVRFSIDSSIINIEEFNAMQRPGKEYLNIGNTGSAAYPLVFSPFQIKGFNHGFNQFEAYQHRFDSVRIYQVMRPYSQIRYWVGQRVEQFFNGKFAAQHKQRIQYGVEFSRFNSRGAYQNQSTNVNGFSLYGNYNPQTNRFSLQTIMVFNSAVVKENGGVEADVFGQGANFFSKQLVPVQLTNATNNYNEIKWMLRGAYHLGKRVTVSNDTSSYTQTIPTFKIGYAFSTGRDRFKYVDSRPDSAYYGNYFTFLDSMKHDASFWLVGNELFFEFTGQTAKREELKLINRNSKTDSLLHFPDTFQQTNGVKSKTRQTNFKAFGSIHFDYLPINQNNFRDRESNLYIQGGFQSNLSSLSKIHYKVRVAYYLAGYNQNDMRLDGAASYSFGKLGSMEGVVNYHLTEAPYIYQNYWGKAHRIINDFPKQSVLAFGGNYRFQHNIISFVANGMYYYTKNYFYFSSPDSAAFDASDANVLVVHAANRLGIKGFHSDNDVWFQLPANTYAIRVPQWVVRSSVYYEQKLFKRVLWFSIGFDLRYNAPFFANTYHPLSGQFFVQDASQLTFYPVLDGFLNIKVRSLRISAKVENISAAFGPKGYYTSPGYPAADLSFKMGVIWRFWE